MIIGKAITAGGSGGIKCKLNITTHPGASVTATLGGKVVEAVADENGKTILELSKEGIWTVTAALDGETVSKEVDTSLSVTAELSFVSEVLAENDWAKISEVAKAGKASQYWKVGDTKDAIYKGESVYRARIVGFDHYDAYSPDSYGREKAGIAFEIFDVSGAAYTYENALTQANTRASSYFDFSDYAIRFKYPVNKLTNGQTGTLTGGTSTKNAKGILPSEQELFGKKTNSYVEEGTQLAFYKAGNSKVKTEVTTTTKVEYWMRSITASGTGGCKGMYVNTSGASKYPSSTTTTRGISYIFCI